MSSYNRLTTIQKAEDLVRVAMRSYDPSHDALHVWRVRRLASKIAQTEIEKHGKNIDLDVVELAALFHDLQDHKYVDGSAQQTSDNDMVKIMTNGGLEQAKADLVLEIIKNTSYSHEKKLRAAGTWGEWHQSCLELHCVQDADRLDAIGTFGIFRVAAYSSAANRPLFQLENEALNSASSFTAGEDTRTQNKSTSVQHFYDKLFLIKDTMKTETGKVVGARRHEIMVKAIDAVYEEFDMSDFP